MEQHFGFFEAKHTYFNQLVQAKACLYKKDFISALNTYTKLLELLNKDYINDHVKYRSKIRNVLSICHELRFYGCFKFLLCDPDNFLKYKHIYVEQLQCDYCKIITKDIFCHPYHTKNSINLKMAIIDLLFNDNFYQVVLLDKKQNFYDLYDNFVKDNQLINQALAILGIALISAYQGDLTIAYSGFNQATKLYNPLNKLVKAIEYCLPLVNNVSIERDSLINNPLSKFKMLQEKIVAASFMIE